MIELHIMGIVASFPGEICLPLIRLCPSVQAGDLTRRTGNALPSFPSLLTYPRIFRRRRRRVVYGYSPETPFGRNSFSESRTSSVSGRTQPSLNSGPWLSGRRCAHTVRSSGGTITNSIIMHEPSVNILARLDLSPTPMALRRGKPRWHLKSLILTRFCQIGDPKYSPTQ